MKPNDTIIGGTALTLLLVGASLLTRKGTAKAWTMVADKPPPPEESNAEVDLREAAAWAIVSGAAVGLARLLIRRTVYPGSPLARR